jgi:hypothetical protein
MRSRTETPVAAQEKPEKKGRAQCGGKNADRHFGGRNQRARKNVGARDQDCAGQRAQRQQRSPPPDFGHSDITLIVAIRFDR